MLGIVLCNKIFKIHRYLIIIRIWKMKKSVVLHDTCDLFIDKNNEYIDEI